MFKEKKMHIKYLTSSKNKNIHWSGPERAIVFQLIFILFERYFIQLGVPSACIYILDVVNVYLLLNLMHTSNKRFSWVILIYIILIGISTLVAFANFSIYGNNIVFTFLEIRNIIRFLIFFLSTVHYFKIENLEKVFSFIELHFLVNSVFIVYMYFTYFPPTASWMRGDLLNGFFGNTRGGNTFVNVEMLVVVLYIFVKWTKKEVKIAHLLLVLGISIIIAGLIELKAYFIEIAFVYIWYLICVQKSRRENRLNLIIIAAAIMIGYFAIKIMIKEYPWFASTLSIKGLLEAFSSQHYSSTEDLNRFTGMITISKRMFQGNIIDTLFGIGLGNGAVSSVAGRTTTFALNYANSKYSWFQGTYLFVQCGLLGLTLYLSTFFILFFKRKKNKYKIFSNMITLLSLFLVFYGEALKTDAGYFIYFSIATGFLISQQEKYQRKVLKQYDDIVNCNTSI